MMTLAMATENEELKIIHVEHDGKFQKKFSDMGIYKDSKVKIVKNNIFRPLIIDIKESLDFRVWPDQKK